MKLRTKLIAAATVSSLLLALCGIGLTVSLMQVRDIRHAEQLLQDATEHLHTMRTLATEQAALNSPRIQRQWSVLTQEAATTTRRLADAMDLGVGAQSEFQTRLNAISNLFDRMVRSQERGGQSQQASAFVVSQIVTESDAIIGRFKSFNASLRQDEASVTQTTAAAVGALILFAIVINWVLFLGFWGWVLTPLQRLRQRASAIGSGNLSDPIENPRADEIGDLYASVEAMRADLLSLTQGLLKQKAEAERANHAKTEFLANMSHELRTPLNAVNGYSELLGRTGDAELDGARVRKFANNIHQAGNHLLGLITDILDIAKIEAGTIRLDETSFPTNDLLAMMRSAFAFRAEKKGIAFTVTQNTLPAFIKSDPIRIRQVLYNLVDNALKFTDDGGEVLVHAWSERLDGTHHRLSVTVQDSGIGIDASRIEDVFEPFTQEEGTITRVYGGTGLGLAISRRIAHALGGDVLARSEKHKGSLFTATFLVEDAEAPLAVPPAKPGLSLSLNRSLRILIVDDVETNLFLIEAFLQPLACTVVKARNGLEAVQFAVKERFDLIFMDIHMPVMDGITATQKIRDHERAGSYRTPIYAWTADIVRERDETMTTADLDGVIAKPVGPSDLESVLSQVTIH